MCFLNSFVDVSCLPNYCANGMIPWPGFPNKCFRVNKKEVHAGSYLDLLFMNTILSERLHKLSLGEDGG